MSVGLIVALIAESVDLKQANTMKHFFYLAVSLSGSIWCALAMFFPMIYTVQLIERLSICSSRHWSLAVMPAKRLMHHSLAIFVVAVVLVFASRGYVLDGISPDNPPRPIKSFLSGMVIAFGLAAFVAALLSCTCFLLTLMPDQARDGSTSE